jgi:hypothetical protein
LDHQSRSGVCTKKKARDRLIRLASTHPQWALGFDDETWWSRWAQPALHAWMPMGQPWHMVEQHRAKTDPEPQALACYGLLVREALSPTAAGPQVWLRFVAGRPVSAVTIEFLRWVCLKLHAVGKTALLLVWDNASWHKSRAVRQWIRDHTRHVKRAAASVRIVVCPLPRKSPWLNPIEAHWVHGKRAVVETARVLTGGELMARVYAHFACPHEPLLTIPEQVF